MERTFTPGKAESLVRRLLEVKTCGWLALFV